MTSSSTDFPSDNSGTVRGTLKIVLRKIGAGFQSYMDTRRKCP